MAAQEHITFEEARKRTLSLTRVRLCNNDMETVEYFYNYLGNKLAGGQ
jgi:hypothetical protein